MGHHCIHCARVTLLAAANTIGTIEIPKIAFTKRHQRSTILIQRYLNVTNECHDQNVNNNIVFLRLSVQFNYILWICIAICALHLAGVFVVIFSFCGHWTFGSDISFACGNRKCSFICSNRTEESQSAFQEKWQMDVVRASIVECTLLIVCLRQCVRAFIISKHP